MRQKKKTNQFLRQTYPKEFFFKYFNFDTKKNFHSFFFGIFEFSRQKLSFAIFEFSRQKLNFAIFEFSRKKLSFQILVNLFTLVLNSGADQN